MTSLASIASPEEALPLIFQLERRLLATGRPSITAPEDGVDKSLAVIRIGGVSLNLINPAVVPSGQDLIDVEERCFSYPDHIFKVSRPEWLVVKNTVFWGDESLASNGQCPFKDIKNPRFVQQEHGFAAWQPTELFGGKVFAQISHCLDLLAGLSVADYFDKHSKNALTMASTKDTKAAEKFGKVGRNEPCPCGSKKKYKHCCGR